MLRTSNQSSTNGTHVSSYVSSKDIFEQDKLTDILFQCKEKGMGLEYVVFEVTHHKMTLETEDLQDIADTLGISYERVLSRLYQFTNLSSTVKGIIRKQNDKASGASKENIDTRNFSDLDDDLRSAKVRAEKLRRERNKKLSKGRFNRTDKYGSTHDSFYHEE